MLRTSGSSRRTFARLRSRLAVDLETGEVRTVQTDAVAGYATPSGHLVFLRGGDLWAAAFDVDT